MQKIEYDIIQHTKLVENLINIEHEQNQLFTADNYKLWKAIADNCIKEGSIKLVDKNKFATGWKESLEESFRLTEDKDKAWKSLDIDYRIMLIMNFYKDYLQTNGSRFWEDLGDKYADAAIDDAMTMEEVGYFHILPSMEAKSIYGPNSKIEWEPEEDYTWEQAFKDVFAEFGGNVKKLLAAIRRK